MPTTTYYTATPLDGHVADEDDDLDWLMEVEGGDDPSGLAAFFAGVGAMVMGATTSEWVLAHDHLVGSPERWREWYGDTPCWVLTHRDLPPIAGIALTFARGDVAAVHADTATAAGDRTIWIVGGGDLAGQFADAGLLDEIVADIAPVTLGAGRPAAAAPRVRASGAARGRAPRPARPAALPSAPAGLSDARRTGRARVAAGPSAVPHRVGLSASSRAPRPRGSPESAPGRPPRRPRRAPRRAAPPASGLR